MAPRTKGKWAQGIQPRNFCWIIKGKLAVCERPGGYGANHRRVRRQEEIIWIREQGFASVISFIDAPHNLHNYEELSVPYLHRPFGALDDPERFLGEFYPELHSIISTGAKVVCHTEEVGDRIAGVMGGYIRWSGLMRDIPQCTVLIETITGRQLDPLGRTFVALAGELPNAIRPQLR